MVSPIKPGDLLILNTKTEPTLWNVPYHIRRDFSARHVTKLYVTFGSIRLGELAIAIAITEMGFGREVCVILGDGRIGWCSIENSGNWRILS